LSALYIWYIQMKTITGPCQMVGEIYANFETMKTEKAFMTPAPIG